MEESAKQKEEVGTLLQDVQMADSTDRHGHNPNIAKKASWKRVAPASAMGEKKEDWGRKKRKSPEDKIETRDKEIEREAETKKTEKRSQGRG
ncbi:hypothetical protein GOBAR_AA33323 [Gossypium barbadense]|uniref:Uncharacterized protein n=1 Tax=Gossypium barbadense TaxID=3634 RepID=A0A2P5W8F1_GOSBA|nr:hypothetical protein GOBAR_AA33323 [Gossypium barbadense]